MPTYPELRDKVAIVTGGNTGIGEAVARRLAAEGAAVVVGGSHRPEDSQRIASEICAAGGRAMPGIADLTRGSEAERLVRETVERFGPVDLLVNSAGGFPARRLLVETDEAEWDWIMAVNLKSAFLMSKAVLPSMIERRYGRIVSLSSEAGRMPVAQTAAHYAASKAGLLGLTRHLAREVAQYGVTVNATAPSTTYSPRVRGIVSAPGVEERMISVTPIGRIAEIDEQVGAVLFLLSDDASYITGATLDVAGGKVML
jgi:NAD(P)-dependent dehydrogenase (short-subunit alcohol dehydrogenase family)